MCRINFMKWLELFYVRKVCFDLEFKKIYVKNLELLYLKFNGNLKYYWIM